MEINLYNMLEQEPKNKSTNPELQKYYKYLRDNNADVPPTYSSFENTLKNSQSAQEYYNYLKSNNFDAPETFDSFQSTFGLKKKESTSTSTTSGKNSELEQKNGSLDSNQYQLKPIVDERGREVYEKVDGKIVPAKEKVLKGFASSTEERQIVREEQKKKASVPIKPTVKYQEYLESTKITDDEKLAVKQEVEDQFNQKGFWNGITAGTKKGFNFLSDVVTTIGTFGTETESPIRMEVDPFVKEKKQAEDQLKLEKKSVTPESIAERAKQIKIQNKIDGLKVDKNNEFLSNLPEEEVKALNLEKVKAYKTLGDKEKYITTKSELLKNDIEKELKDYNIAKAIIEKNNQAGIETNPELIQFAISTEDKAKQLLADAENLEKEALENQENIGSAEEEIDFLKRNYDTVDKVTTLAKLGFGDIYVNLALKQELFLGDTFGTIEDERKKEIIDQTIDWETAKNLAKSNVKRDVDFDNLSINNFGQFFAQELGTQLPIFAQMAMPGGITSIGLTSTFDKYGRMEQESNNISFEFDGKQLNGFEKENGEIVDSLGNTYNPNEVKITSLRTADQSALNKAITSITFGTAEAVLGALPTKNIFGRALNSIQNSGQRTLFRESIKQFTKAKAATVLNATTTEVVSEGATQVVQNIADIASGKKDVGVFDNVDHAAVSAGMLSFFMSASPAVAGIALKPFAQNKENKQVNDNLQQIFSLQEQLKNTEISDVSRAAIQGKIESLEKANSETLDSIANRTKGISKEVFDAIRDVNKKQEILTIQATEIRNDNSLDVEVKKELIADLEAKFNQLEKKRATLVGGNATILDALPNSESASLIEKAKSELEKTSTDENPAFTEEQINKKAIEIYNQSNTNAIQQETTITEEKPETQPQAEVQETEQEVLETPTAQVRIYEYNGKKYNITDNGGVEVFSNGNENMIPLDLVEEIEKNGNYLGSINNTEVLNETTPTSNTPTNGDIRPGIEPMAEVGGTTKQTTEDVTTESIPQATEPTTSQRETKRVVSKTIRRPSTGEAAEFDVDIVDGQVVEIRKPRTGKVVPKFVEVIDKVTKKVKRVQRNANWTAIADEALGQRTNNDIAKEDKAIVDRAIQSFEPSNEYEHALQFFATGGNVNSQSAQKETGLSNKEIKWATGFKPDSELPSVEAIAEKIVMNAEKDGVTVLDMQEVRGALIDIIKSKTRDSVKQEVAEIKKSIQEGKELQETNDYLNSLTQEEYNEYRRMEADTAIELSEQEFLASMTENEIIDYFEQLFNEQQQSEQEYYENREQQREQRSKNKTRGTESPSVQEIPGESKSESEQEIDTSTLEDDIEVQAQGVTSRKPRRDLTLMGKVANLFPFKKKMKKIWNNTFRSNSGLDFKTGEVLRGLNREVAAFSDHLAHEAKEFGKIISDVSKKHKKDIDAKLYAINDYISGNKNADISFLTQEQAQTLDYYRQRIDSLSDSLISIIEDKLVDMQYRLSNLDPTKNKVAYENLSNAIDQTNDLIKTIKDNQGKYINRSYQIFSDEQYRKDITGNFDELNKEGKKRVLNAINYLIREEGLSRDEATKQIAAYLADIRNKKDDYPFTPSGEAIATFLKKKKEIPQEFRELLGESKDPLYNYVNTVYKISKYIANLGYQTQLREHLITSGIGTTEAKLGYEKLSGSGQGFAILNDIYVPVEVKEAIDDMEPLKTIESGFYRTWIKFAGMVKLNKTILSPTSTARNLISGIFLGINSGHFFAKNPKAMMTAWNMAWGNKKSQTELLSERRKLIRLGILLDGSASGELLATLNDFSKETDRMVSQSNFEKAFEFFKKTYAFGDDFYKVVGFYAEKKALIDNGISEEKAEKMAAERIVMGYPTYSYLPKNIQKLRRLPLVGTFVSFPYEVWRTSKNNLMIMLEDAEAGRTRMAVERGVGFLVASSIASGLSAGSMALLGISDDDDDAIRDGLPEWQKNSKLIYLGTKDGKPQFIDATPLFAGETIFKLTNIILEKRAGRNFEDKVEIALQEFLSPYLSADLTTKTIKEVLENENAFNQPIYRSDNLKDALFNLEDNQKIVNYLMKQVGPGVYNNITEFLKANEVAPQLVGEKYTNYGKEYTNQEALLALFGIRFSSINYEGSLSNFAKDIKKKEGQDKNDINRFVKTTIKLDEGDLDKSIERYQKYHDENYTKLLNMVNSAKKFGMTNPEIANTLGTSGYSEKERLMIVKYQTSPLLKPISLQTAKNYLATLKMNYKGQEKKYEEIQKNFLENATKFNKKIMQHNIEIAKKQKIQGQDVGILFDLN